MAYSTAIIGLGNIGMLYDLKLDSSRFVYSHVNAIKKHRGFRLLGGVDCSAKHRKIFTDKNGIVAHKKIEDLLVLKKPDVVVVATPTETHFNVIKTTLALHRPKVILCEKPLSYSTEEGRQIVDLCKKSRVGLYLNYIRRCDPGVDEIKNRISSGKIITPCKGVVWYSKGLIHNGSHFLDLLSFWLGAVKSADIINKGRRIGGCDSEPDVHFRFQNGIIVFLSAQEEKISHYSIELMSDNGRLRYERSGKMTWQNVKKHQQLKKYSILDEESEVIEGEMDRYQYNVYQQLQLLLSGKKHNLCSGKESLVNQKILSSLLSY
jgi:predicted dehydrogenase